MTSDDRMTAAVEAGAAALNRVHWRGTECGTNDNTACGNCFGGSGMDSREVAEAAIAAALPVLLADRDAEVARFRDSVTYLEARVQHGDDAAKDDRAAVLERIEFLRKQARRQADDLGQAKVDLREARAERDRLAAGVRELVREWDADYIAGHVVKQRLRALLTPVPADAADEVRGQ